ncbi:MAG: hypothetical protein HC858_05885 [Brachymonas sp.]|nr:hypothetical protein [Brachymonas sp.]
MSTSALIQIIKVNELRTGNKNGRDWQMQDCECLLLNDDGTPSQVGVTMLPKNMRGENAPKPGKYTGQFSLQAGMQDRRIMAVLVGLVPVPEPKTTSLNMPTGIWTPQGCKPTAVAAAMDCNGYTGQWGNGNTAYSSFCTSSAAGASNTYTLTLQRCNNKTCTSLGDVTRTGAYCDTDATTGPYNLSTGDATQLAGLIIAVWIAGAVTRWLVRALDNSPGVTS